MLNANDIGGQYTTPIAQSLTNIEDTLANILRSKAAATYVREKIFGSSIIFDASAIGRLLRINLASLEALELSEKQTRSLKAALDLGKLMYATTPNRPIIDEVSRATSYFTNAIGWEIVEHFAVLVLDIKHHVIGFETISKGSMSETLAHPREIFTAVLRMGGCRLIVGHNHPSGCMIASPEDILLTQNLLEASKIMGIPMLDHLIVAENSAISLRETTHLWHGFPEN
jgi:DNA repair protein RadC